MLNIVPKVSVAIHGQFFIKLAQRPENRNSLFILLQFVKDKFYKT